MKRQIAVIMTLAALATSALAVVQTNTFQFGGEGSDKNWSNGIVTNAPNVYSVSSGLPAEYTDLSNVEFTVSFTETNGIPVGWAASWLYATIDDGVTDRRINSNDVLRLTVSYSDPDNKLKGLRLAGIGTMWNTLSYETLVFSDGTTSTNITDSSNDTIFDYEALGLTPLSTNNISTWEMFVSADDFLGGGTNFTEAAMGAFVLEYIVDSTYVPPVPVSFTFVNGNGLDSVGVGGNISLSNITITTVDVIGQDGSLASLGADNKMNTTGASDSLGVNSDANIVGASQDARDFDPNEGWVFSFNTNVYLMEIDFASWGDVLPTEMVISNADFNIALSGTSANGTFDLGNTYVPAGTPVTLQMSTHTDTNFYDISTRISYFTVAIAPAPITDPYVQWVLDQGLTPGVNDALDYDVEPDGMDNLLEYALGGNSQSNDAAGLLPGYAIGQDGSTNYLNYVYRRRIDYEDRDLLYVVGAASDLVTDAITNETVEAGSVAIDAEFESVTNRVSTDVESAQFMQLKVTIE